MRKVNYFLLSTLFIMFSCNPCKNLDCLYSDYTGEFRIVDKQNGEDLVFGSSKIYDKSKIRFYAMEGTDTIHLQYSPVKPSGPEVDSVLNVDFYSVSIKTVYLELSRMDTDTITVNYKSYDTKCCGRITEIAKFTYNHTFDLPGKGVHKIKK